ncbi:hypothetical protein L3X38_030429 [Prunus dulcis]|uniref:Mediator complex subunit 15 KIX domain-containing protein n=1 Tax=Prunus dulcis TaxID=3755 RepID=A0AAD4VBB3_PRUDU|nr:hypothetical protein L3X38_030429 [Prunus dulcis]
MFYRKGINYYSPPLQRLENNNGRPPQVAEPSIDAGGDWRSQLPPGGRQRIPNQIMDTVQKLLPPDQVGQELMKIAVSPFEENDLMDNNNWRPPQVGETPIDARDWRSQLQPDSRQRIVNKITDILKRHLPFSGQEGLQEIMKIAVRFEEKIHTAATSQSDYLRKISLKMLSMETNSQHRMANSSQSNSAGSFGVQPQVPYQGQLLSMQLSANQSLARQQLLSQNIPNNIPPASGLPQTPIPNLMDTHNERLLQGGELPMVAGNWRNQLLPDSRRRIVDKILNTLKRHLLVSGQEGIDELRRIAERFEERTYDSSSSQSDYLRRISLKMLTFEAKYQWTAPTAAPSNLNRHRVFP